MAQMFIWGDCMSIIEKKTVLITGAAQRIGRAIALALAADGWSVGVHYNASKSEAHALVEEINVQGGKADTICADLRDETSMANLITDTKSKLGVVSCLINNAAVFEKDSILESDREIWDRHMHVNLRAPYVLTHTFVKELPEPLMGNVINLIDQRVWNLAPGFTSYTLSKSALWTLTQTAALALAPRIRVNAIGPGPTLPSVHQSNEQFKQQCESVPLNHGTNPEEIAATVRFILDAPSITGQMIAVDGGQHLGSVT
jgi:NAD(P)-dependent dehydrogenase (short-subunit alcohol dehydrogenase family)